MAVKQFSSTVQLLPPQPPLQLQLNVLAPMGEQVPPCAHGALAQAVDASLQPGP
jgi:hypothetical protein